MRTSHRLQLWLLTAACSALVVFFLWVLRPWEDAPLVAVELWVFSALTLEAGLTDFFSRRIPNIVLLILALLGLLLGALETYAGFPAHGITDAVTLMDRLIAMGASAVLFSLVKLLFERFSHQQQLGWGDIKFLIALGAWCSFVELLNILFVAALIGVASAVIAKLRHGAFKSVRLGFWLSLAAVFLKALSLSITT